MYVIVAIPWKGLLPSGKHLSDARWAERPYSFCPSRTPAVYTMSRLLRHQNSWQVANRLDRAGATYVGLLQVPPWFPPWVRCRPSWGASATWCWAPPAWSGGPSERGWPPPHAACWPPAAPATHTNIFKILFTRNSPNWARICKRLWSPEIDSASLCSLAACGPLRHVGLSYRLTKQGIDS